MIIRYCQVDVRFANSSTHNDREIQAFNTDGFDLAGSNIHIHKWVVSVGLASYPFPPHQLSTIVRHASDVPLFLNLAQRQHLERRRL